MKIKQLAFLIPAGLIVTGCGLLGPTYEKPQLNSPNNWASKDRQTSAESMNLAQTAWWQKFNDPMLNQLIESALGNNNNIQIAMGNMLQAQASLRQVNMGWIPTVSIGGGGMVGQAFNPSFTNNTAQQLPNVAQGTQNISGYGYGVIPTYTLNVFEQIKRGEIAKLSLEMQKQNINAVRLGVISQVASSYFTLLGLHRQLELQQQLLADALDLRKFTQIKLDKGSVSDLNLQGLDQYIASVRANIPMIKSDITQAENALQVLTNNNPGKIKLNNNFDKITTNNIVPVNLPSAVLESRPDVAIAEYQLKVANADIGAARSMFFPTISLTGMLGQGSMTLTNLFTAGGDLWMTQLAAFMPAFNMGIYAQIDKAKAGYYTAYYNYAQTVRSAFAQVDNSLASHDSLTENLKERQQSLDKANNIYSIAQKQYKYGSIAYADTLNLKLNVDYALASQNQVKIQQLNSLVNLYQALGGGYLVESSLSATKKFNDGHDI